MGPHDQISALSEKFKNQLNLPVYTNQGVGQHLPTNWTRAPWGIVWGHFVPHGKAALQSEIDNVGDTGKFLQPGREDRYFTQLEEKRIVYPRGQLHWYGDGSFSVSYYATTPFRGESFTTVRKKDEDAAWEVAKELEKQGFHLVKVMPFDKKTNPGRYVGDVAPKAPLETALPPIKMTPDDEARLNRLEMFGNFKVKTIKEALRRIRYSSWQEVSEKAKRLKDEGKVNITSNTPQAAEAIVQGDTGTYHLTIFKDEQNYRKISHWECECPWGRYAWLRTRQWKKFEGRPCSHVLAAYWSALKAPVDQNQQQLFTPQQQTPTTPQSPSTNKWETIQQPTPAPPTGPVPGMQQQMQFPGISPLFPQVQSHSKWKLVE